MAEVTTSAASDVLSASTDAEGQTSHDANTAGDGSKEGAQGSESLEVPTTNGDNSHDQKNIEMKDQLDSHEAGVSTADPAAHVVNGTPASTKRTNTGGSSKKKSSAVPEHKSKKLNKKKSKPLTHLDARPGEYYIARMKGHPPWPSVICDEDMLPHSLLSTRPVTAKLADGSFKKPEYADGGKRAYERTFPIMFLHTNEFAWIPNTELAVLDVESDAVKLPVEKGKSKTLLAAYEKAAENNGLEHFKGMLADHQKALEADLQEREELEKERVAKKAKKASRKSDAVVDPDEMDIDEDAPAEKPKSKKRKKADENEDVDEKPAKAPKTATKLKLSTPKTPTAEPSAKKKASKPKATKAAKSASEDETATPKVEEKTLTPAQAREMKEKKVLYYRHKLQRGFLSRDTTPKEEEMKPMSEFLSELEGYPDLEGSIIRATKIHKVLKAMIKLTSIPLDEEFHFRERSVDLLAKWNEILSNDTSAAAPGDKDDEAKGEEAAPNGAPTTNGDTKMTGEQAAAAEAGDSAAPEDQPEAALEKKIGTSVEGEKEAEKSVTEPAKTAGETATDAPAVDSNPAGEYKPEDEAGA